MELPTIIKCMKYFVIHYDLIDVFLLGKHQILLCLVEAVYLNRRRICFQLLQRLITRKFAPEIFNTHHTLVCS